jgi:hypothetical protein
VNGGDACDDTGVTNLAQSGQLRQT